LSCPDSIRASTLQSAATFGMDCRVKPGNDKGIERMRLCASQSYQVLSARRAAASISAPWCVQDAPARATKASAAVPGSGSLAGSSPG
jgi:hypothetical protein